MRLSYTLLLALWASTICITNGLLAQSNIKYGPDYIVFEAEDTSSPLDKWVLRTPGDPKYYVGTDLEALNQTYIDFRGPWASKASPLSYTFTCPKTGNYRLVMRMYQPLQPDEKGDQRNDVFIKMAGNFTSQTNTTKSELETEHKFWGRGVRKWGSCHKLEIGGTHMNAIYGFIQGEQYTLTMSGRSPWTSIDYILLYDVDLNFQVVNHTDIAVALPIQYQPNVATSISAPLSAKSVFSIHPNPTQGNISLSLLGSTEKTSVSIYNLAGQQVFHQQYISMHEEIDLSGMGTGLYFVEVNQRDGTFTQKLIIR